jgi:hypothetical protein
MDWTQHIAKLDFLCASAVSYESYHGLFSLLQDQLMVRKELQVAPDSSAISVESKDEIRFHGILESFIARLLKRESLSSLWRDLLESYFHKSKTLTMKQIQGLLSGHRILGNYYETEIHNKCNGKLGCRNWNYNILTALFDIIYVESNSNLTPQNLEAINDIISFDNLSRECQVVVLEYLLDCNKREKIIDTMSPEWSLNAIKLLLHPTVATILKLRQNEALNMLKLLLIRSTKSTESVEVLNKVIFLNKVYSKSVVTTYIELLPATLILQLLHEVTSLWSDKIFISRGDDLYQDYLTHAILLGLEKLDDVHSLSVPGPNGKALATLFSHGIGNYFDSNGKTSKIYGMKVARKFSQLMGHPIEFDELKDSASNATSRDNSTENPLVAPKVENDSSDSSGDSDSEIEGYDLGEDVSANEKIKSTSYLRICLDMLQCSDSNPDAYKNQHSALVSIPEIVSRQPVDVRDICAPLMKELLRLANSYNLEEFSNLRSTAIQSLLVAYPGIAVPVATNSLSCDSTHVGAKIDSLRELIYAAYSLSGIDNNTASASRNPVIDGKELESANSSAENIVMKNTKIKRPAKLAQSKRRIRYYRNNFSSVAHLFFKPMGSLLQSYTRLKMPESTVSYHKDTIFDSLFTTPASNGSKVAFYNPEFSKSVTSNEEMDSVDAIVMSQALLALGCFVKCIHNDVNQVAYIIDAANATCFFLQSAHNGVRKSALVTMFDVAKAWKELHFNSRNTSLTAYSTDILSALTDVLGQRAPNKDVHIGLELDKIMMKFVDWCVMSAKTDPDKECSLLKNAIAAEAIETLALINPDANNH